MPVEKQLKPEEAVAEAEKALAGLVPVAVPKPVELTPKEEKVAEQLEKAEESASSLSAYASELEKKLPVDVEYESQKMLADLEKSRIKEKEVMGELRYVNETADIEKTIKTAQEYEKAGKHDDAVKLIKTAQAKMTLLGEIISTQRDLAVVGAPSEVLDGVQKAYEFYSKGETNRANFIMQSAAMYQKFPEVYKSNAELSQSIVGVISELSSGKEISAEDAKGTYIDFAGETTKIANRQALVNGVQSDEYIEKLGYIHEKATGKFKEQTGELLDRLNDVRGRLSDEKTMGKVSEEELKALYGSVQIALKANTMISSVGEEYTETIDALDAIYYNALKASMEGKKNEADFHLFAANEYLFSAGDEAYRKGTVASSNKLAEGKLSYTEIYQKYYLSLHKKMEKDKNLAEFAATFKPAEKLAEKEMDVNRLLAMRQALNFSSYASESVKKLGKEYEKPATGFLENGLSALKKGDLGTGAMQLRLFNQYTLSMDAGEREKIANLSETLEKNPERGMVLANQLVFLTDISTNLNAAMAATGGKEHEITGECLAYNEELRDMVLGGEALTENEELGAYLHSQIAFAMLDGVAKGTATDKSLDVFNESLFLAREGQLEKSMVLAQDAVMMGKLDEKNQANLDYVSYQTASTEVTTEDSEFVSKIYQSRDAVMGELESKINYFEGLVKKRDELAAKKDKTEKDKEKLKALNDKVKKNEAYLKYLKGVAKKTENYYDMALQFNEKGDKTSASCLVNSAEVYAKVKLLSKEARQTDEAKASLATAESIYKAGSTALEQNKTIVDVTGKGAEQIGTEIVFANLDAKGAEIVSDSEKVIASTQKKRYESENADLELVKSMCSESVKLYNEGKKNIDKAFELREQGKTDEAQEHFLAGLSQMDYASKLMLATKQYNYSVMFMVTENKTAGRTDLLGAMKLYYALGNGVMLNQKGFMLVSADNKPVQLDTETVQQYEQQADKLYDSGFDAVEEQKAVNSKARKIVNGVKEAKKKNAESVEMKKENEQLTTEQSEELDSWQKESEKSLNKASNQAKKGKLKAAYSSLSKGAGLADCSLGFLKTYEHEKELKADQAKASEDAANNFLSVAGSIFPSITSKTGEDKKGELLDLFTPPAELKTYDGDKYRDGYGLAAGAYMEGDLKGGNQVLGEINKEANKAYKDQLIDNHQHANAQAKAAFMKLDSYAPLFLLEQKPEEETAKQEEQREERNKKLADEVLPAISEKLDGYAAEMDELSANWQKVKTGEMAYEDAVAQENAYAKLFDQRKEAWEMAMNEVRIGTDSLKIAHNMELNAKLEGLPKSKGMDDLNACATEGWNIAKGVLNNADSLDLYLKNNTGFAESLFELRKKKYAAIAGVALNSSEAKGYLATMARRDTEGTLGNWGYSVEWEKVGKTETDKAAGFTKTEYLSMEEKLGEKITERKKAGMELDELKKQPETKESEKKIAELEEKIGKLDGEIEAGREKLQGLYVDRSALAEEMNELKKQPETKENEKKIAELEKKIGEIDNELKGDKVKLEIMQESYGKFRILESTVTAAIIGSGGFWSTMISEDAQTDLIKSCTSAAVQYNKATDTILEGGTAAAAEKYIENGDAWLEKKHAHGVATSDMVWAAVKTGGTGAFLGPLGAGVMGYLSYKKLKDKAKAEESEIAYMQTKLKEMESYSRMARMGTSIVSTGILFAASPVTAGTSALAAAGIMTMESTAGLTEFYTSTGGWNYMTGGQKALFVFDIGMTGAMALLPGGGMIVEEAMMSAMTFDEMVAGVAQVPKGVHLAGKAMELAGKGVIGAGTLRGALDVGNIVDGVNTGQMTMAEAVFTFASMALPMMQMGLYSFRISKAVKAGGAPEYVYRSKPTQFLEAIFLGTPMDDPFVHHMSAEAYKTSKLLSQADPVDAAYYDAYKAHRVEEGMPIDVVEETTIITEFTGMKKALTDFTMQDYLEFTVWKTQPENIMKEPAAAMNDFVIASKLDPAEQAVWHTFIGNVEKGGIPLGEAVKTLIIGDFLEMRAKAMSEGKELNLPEYLLKAKFVEDNLKPILKTIKTKAQEGEKIKKEAPEQVMPLAVGSEYTVVAPKKAAAVSSAEAAAHIAPPKQKGAQEVGSVVEKTPFRNIEEMAKAEVIAKINKGEVLKPGESIHIAGTEENIILKKTVIMDSVESWVVELTKTSDAKQLEMIVIAVDKSGLNNEHVKGGSYIDATGNEIKIKENAPADVLSQKVLDDMLVEMKNYLKGQGYEVAIAKMGEGNCDERMFVVVGEKVPTPEIMEKAKEHARAKLGEDIGGGKYTVNVEGTTMTLKEWAENNYPMDKDKGALERMTAFSMDFSATQIIKGKKGKVNVVESGYNEAVKAEMPYIEATMDAMGIGKKKGQLAPSTSFDPQSQNYAEAKFEEGYVVQTIIKPNKAKKAEFEVALNEMIAKQDLSALPERLRGDYKMFQAKIGLGEKVTFEEFVNICTRKGYSFWEMVSFSEGNTILGYDGMNALGNKSAEGVVKALGIKPADEVYLGNLMWYQKGKAKPDAEAVKKAINFEGAAFDVEVQVVKVKKGQTLADAEAKIFQETVAKDIGIDVDAATLKNLEIIVRIKDPYVQDKVFDVPVTGELAKIADELGYTSKDATIVLKYIAYEIGTNRSIRRARDIINYLKKAGRYEDAKLLLAYAKYNGKQARQKYQELVKPPVKAPVTLVTPALTPQGQAVLAFAKEHPPKAVYEGQYVTKVEGASAIAAIGDVHGDAGRLLYFLTQENPETGVPILKVKPGKEENVKMVEKTLKDGSKRSIIDIPEGVDVQKWMSENFDIIQHDGMQVVFTGDYLDRGEQGLQVMDVVMWMEKNAGESMTVHALTGNHEKIFQRFLSEYGDKTTADVETILGIKMMGYGRVGMKETYESIKAKYANDPRFLEATEKGADAWQTMVKLLKEDGYIPWIESLKAAAIIDNNLFTHGGPVLGAKTPKEFDAHFAKVFESPENNWSAAGDLGPTDFPMINAAKEAEDYSAVYASQWLEMMKINPGLKEKFDAWKAAMGIDNIYVGHEANKTFAFNPDMGVAVIDGALSRWYGGGESGVVYIDPASKTPAAWLAESPEGIKLLDIGFGKKRNQVLKNGIAEHAAKVYGEAKKKPPPPPPAPKKAVKKLIPPTEAVMKKAKAVEKVGLLPVTEEQVLKILKGDKSLLEHKNIVELADAFVKIKSADDRAAVMGYCKNTEGLDRAFGVLRDTNILMENKPLIQEVYGDFDVIFNSYMKGVKDAQKAGLLFPELDGRTELLKTLITDLPARFEHDEALKSILFDLLPDAKKSFGGKIDGVKKLEGATGAYELSIHLMDESGEYIYDADANPVKSKVYLKLEEAAPEKQGISISKESGIIAPDIKAYGEYLSFYKPEGSMKWERTTKKYFITENVSEIKDGTMKLAGQEVVFDTAAASPWIGVLTNAELGGYVKNNVNEVKKLYGEHWAAALVNGTLDRHSKNVWFFKIDVSKNSPKVLAHLEANGYTIITEADGKKYMYRFGSIDLDSAGFYSVKLSNKGEPEVGIGPKEFTNSAYGTSGMILKFFGIEGKPIPAPEDVATFFTPDSPFAEGVAKWLGEHKNDKAYRSGIEKQYKIYEGDVGIAHVLGWLEDGMLKKGIPVPGGKFAGEEGSFFINPENSRYKFLAEGDRLLNKAENLEEVIPKQDTVYYLAPVKPGEKPANTIELGVSKPKEFEVIKIAEGEPVPEGAFAVRRIGKNIIAEPGTGKAIGVETVKTGAIACFNALLDLSPEGWAGVMGQVEESVLNDPMLKGMFRP